MLGHVAEVRLSTATTSIGSDLTVTSHVTFMLKYQGLFVFIFTDVVLATKVLVSSASTTEKK